MLTTIMWEPVQPGTWWNTDRTANATLTNVASVNEEIASAVASDYDVLAWKHASKHFMGKGIEKGMPSLNAAKKGEKETHQNRRL